MFVLVIALLVLVLDFLGAFVHTSVHRATKSRMSLTMTSIGDLQGMNVKEAISAVLGSEPVPADLQYENTDILRKSPGVCKFVIANPKAFVDPVNSAAAMLRGGIDHADLDLSKPATR